MSAADFDAIEAAVMETERGRWFLAEFARRRRAEDTTRILTAVDRLEARAAQAEANEVRAKLDADRAARLMRELADLIAELRPAADARARAAALASIAAAGRSPDAARDLESRLAGLVHLDALDLETKLKLLG